LPSPKLSRIPKGQLKEELFESGFAVSGFELNTGDSEKELREKINTVFKDIFSFSDKVFHFEYVRAIEKGVVKVKLDGPMDGRMMYFIAGSRQLPIYIRSKSDFRHFLKSKDQFCPSEIEDSSEEDLEPVLKKPNDDNLFSPQPKPNDDYLFSPQRTGSRQTTLQECPICKELFTSDIINCHASVCGDDNSVIETHPSTSIFTPTVTRSTTTAISVSSCTISKPPNKTFKEELRKIQNKFTNSEELPIKFVIRLNNAYLDLAKKIKLFFKRENPLRPITVSFPGEVGVDDGGPSREMFSRAFSDASKYILNGMEMNYTLQHDVHKCESDEFFVYGQMVALSLLHGFAGPHNLAKPLAHKILGLKPDLEISDIPDFEVQQKLKEIEVCNSKETLSLLMENFDQRFEAGYVS